MRFASGAWPLVLAVAGMLCASGSAQDAGRTPAPSPPPPAAPAPVAPPAPPAGEGGDGISVRVRDLRPAARTVNYDGAVMRLRQRSAARASRARDPEEAKWRQGVDNLSVDPITRRPMGVYLFMVRY